MIIDYFLNNQDRPMIHKPLAYFPIYEKHFSRFRHTKVRILEIGVENGGSLLMWKNYFGSGCEVIGVDINPKCKEFEKDKIRIYIGDQADKSFLNDLLIREKEFNIIIDDGGHHSVQQITSFRFLYFNMLLFGGVYLCEDVGTSYMTEYSGGMRKPDTFIEFSKGLIDEVNNDGRRTSFTDITSSISFYSGIVVFEKELMIEHRTLAIGEKRI